VSGDRELFGDPLPSYLTRFVGRKHELGELCRLLRTHRLVTLCGVGGSGKTRLAIEAARQRRQAAEDGEPSELGWIPLVGVANPTEVARVIALALGMPEATSLDPLPALAATLAGRRMLLVLDNCEHIAAACADVAGKLLEAASGLVVLVTSRVALQHPSEVVYAVPPLGLANGNGRADGHDALDLFIDRVTTIAPGYALTELNAPQLTSICRRLDGLPLAIELAASWVRVLSAQDLLHEVDRSIDLLTAQPVGIEERHRSMRAVLDSSWRWLGPTEQAAFVRLGAFVGGFTRAAGEQVAGATLATLAVLTEGTLIQRLPDRTGGTRYHVHELVRDYALARLEDDHELAEAVRLNHLRYFLGVVEQAEVVWDTAKEPAILAVLEADRANIEAALWWALDRGRAIDALQMCAGLFTFWIYTSSRSGYTPLLALTLPWPEGSAAGVLAPGQGVERRRVRRRCRWRFRPGARALPRSARAVPALR
jgi:predicted ATPase